MERWSGRVALVTGASAGIGAAIAVSLAKHGMRVVGMARRDNRVQELASSIGHGPGKLYSFKGDVRNEEDVLAVFAWVKKHLGGVDVFVNNAGVLYETTIHDGKLEDWKHMMDVNVMGLSMCTREAIKDMRERGVSDGHIILINSIAGHIKVNRPGFLMYTATKNAVTVLAEGIRAEVQTLGVATKVTCISPGLVRTELFSNDNMKEMTPEKLFSENRYMESQDIADAVIYVLGTPKHVEVYDIIMRSTNQ